PHPFPARRSSDLTSAEKLSHPLAHLLVRQPEGDVGRHHDRRCLGSGVGDRNGSPDVFSEPDTGINRIASTWTYLEVKVTPGGVSLRAHGTDWFARGHRLSGGHQHRLHVCVPSGDASVTRIDGHEPAPGPCLVSTHRDDAPGR